MAQIFGARRAKEIKLSYENKLFEYFYDDEPIFGDKFASYIKFKNSDGIYKDQTHIIKLKFDYGNGNYMFPKDPPNVVFLTPIYHVNISTNGLVCLDTIKDKWTPTLGFEAVFNSIILLLEDGNILSPFNGDAAHDYKKLSKEEYSKVTLDYYLKKIKADESVQPLLYSSELNMKKLYN
jgi:ubiquitin-protein ligase